MEKITFRQMLAECNRELSMRAKVYPERVASRRMTQATADRQTNVMVALVEHLTPLADAEKANEAAAQPYLDL